MKMASGGRLFESIATRVKMSRLGRWGFVAAAGGALLLAASVVSRAGASSGGPTIAVDSLNSSVGGIAKVEVSVADVAAPGVGAWTVDLHFDPEILSGITCTSEQGGGICNAQYDPGVARIVGTNIYGLEGDATLASIGFGCKSPGETTLELVYSVFVDATPGNPTDVEAKLVNGTATCEEGSAEPTPTPPGSDPKSAGDANCDGVVNAVDASLVLQFTAGLIHSLTCDDADFDHNGQINALDAALILQTDAGLIP
jgi:hypothetical protein